MVLLPVGDDRWCRSDRCQLTQSPAWCHVPGRAAELRQGVSTAFSPAVCAKGSHGGRQCEPRCTLHGAQWHSEVPCARSAARADSRGSARNTAVLLRVSTQRCARRSLHTHPCRLQTHTASDAARARSGSCHGPSSPGISSPLLTPFPPMERMEPAWAKRRQTGGKTPCSASRVSAPSGCSAAGLLMNKHNGQQSALRCPAGRQFHNFLLETL